MSVETQPSLPSFHTAQASRWSWLTEIKVDGKGEAEPRARRRLP